MSSQDVVLTEKETEIIVKMEDDLLDMWHRLRSRISVMEPDDDSITAVVTAMERIAAARQRVIDLEAFAPADID